MHDRPVLLLVSPYWREHHRWMVSSVKLSELWQRMGYRVVVVCMGAVTRIEHVSETLEIHYRKDVFLRDPWNYGIALGFGRYVCALHQELRPAVTVVNKVLFWSSFSLLSLRMRGVRTLLLTDALVGMTWWPRGALPRLCAALYAWTAGWLLLCVASRVVFFHPQPPRLLGMLGIRCKSMVIPTGIDASAFSPRVSTAPKDASVRITYIGRLESVKGVDDFLAAVDPLIDAYDIRVQVAGHIRAGHPLVEQYKNRVQFLGLCEDIPALLAQTDIFVLPSYSEGLSNALMEAMSSGVACIASAVGGNTFLIQHEKNGLLLPPGDRAVLTQHLRRLIDDAPKRHALGMAARARIEESFDWSVVTDHYTQLFASMQRK